MAFEDRDTSQPRTGDELHSVEEITFRRNRNLPGVQLDVIVYTEVDGVRSAKQVPAAKVDAAWSGIRGHLLAAIDNAE